MNILTLNIKCFTFHVTKCQHTFLPTEHNNDKRVYTSFHPVFAGDKAHVTAGRSELWNDYKIRLTQKYIWSGRDKHETVLNLSGVSHATPTYYFIAIYKFVVN
jgi:hypothetical protein